MGRARCRSGSGAPLREQGPRGPDRSTLRATCERTRALPRGAEPPPPAPVLRAFFSNLLEIRRLLGRARPTADAAAARRIAPASVPRIHPRSTARFVARLTAATYARWSG